MKLYWHPAMQVMYKVVLVVFNLSKMTLKKGTFGQKIILIRRKKINVISDQF
jgi:hypothetical protein